MNKFNDNDIREALSRSEAEKTAPEVPDDFLASIMDKIEAEPKNKTVKLWRWVAAAACIALVAGIGSAILFADKTVQESTMVAEITTKENTEYQQINNTETDTATEQATIIEPKVETPNLKAKPAAKPNPATELQPAPNPNLRMERPNFAENKPTTVAEDSASTGNVATQKAIDNNYAENKPQNNYKYLDPALMDEFILKMAEFQGVSKIKSECSATSDADFVESFYVFPIKEDFDVLGRFLLMASQYPNTVPGYIFNNSEQQILFAVDDEPNGLNYLWIAERIGNSQIMIYSTHAPNNIEYESDCYQQFHNNLTIANLNTYY